MHNGGRGFIRNTRRTVFTDAHRPCTVSQECFKLFTVVSYLFSFLLLFPKKQRNFRETREKGYWRRLTQTEVLKEYRRAKSRPRSFAVGALSFFGRVQNRVKGAPRPYSNILSLELFRFLARTLFERFLHAVCFQSRNSNVSKGKHFDTVAKQNKVRRGTRIERERQEGRRCKQF